MHIFLLVISEFKLEALVKRQHVLLIGVSILLKTFIVECTLAFLSLGNNSLMCISAYFIVVSEPAGSAQISCL